ncbi:MAG: DUF3368 domain-containing protein [Candidatus Sumerlaeota bacterium]|nr:DUF3368 domain-containing protein [Candidatus Sumerlaeota bacterium]
MSEAICNTSPLQYLHQAGQIHLLPAVVGTIVVPPAVVNELSAGRNLGVSVPNLASYEWIKVRQPISTAIFPLITDLGLGEIEVLSLSLENGRCTVILDDELARHAAFSLGIPVVGTLGILIQAKQIGLISKVAPILEQLQSLDFRLSSFTRKVVLIKSGEDR